MSYRERIQSELGVQSTISPERELTARAQFLVEQLEHTGRAGYVLGISGGQDSLLAGLLAQQAVERIRDNGGVAEFHAVLLPYGQQVDRADAELAITTIRPDVTHDIDIRPAVDTTVESYEHATDQAISDFDKGNIKARQRMIQQYAVAAANDLLVLGTDHAAEAVTGFFTKFGDGAADVLPLAGLTKRQGRALLRACNVPDVFVTKPPTADLLDDRPGQTDEAELGLTYDQIDDYLEGIPVDQATAAQLEKRYQSTTHKRTMPTAYHST